MTYKHVDGARRILATWCAGAYDIEYDDFEAADDLLYALEEAGLVIVSQKKIDVDMRHKLREAREQLIQELANPIIDDAPRKRIRI